MKIRGHETFYMRKGWLHKGVKNINNNDGRLFSDKDSNACDILGVGVNQVKSIRYWLTATGVCEEVKISNKTHMVITDFGRIIHEHDEFHEEFGTNLLLHYKLATNKENATAWYWLFNHYEPSIIDKSIFEQELNFYLVNDLNASESKVLDDEYACIVKTYIADEKEEDPEELKVCPFSELGLFSREDKKSREISKTMPQLENIDPLIAYAIICDNNEEKQDEIRFDRILNGVNNLGKVFNLTRIPLMKILDKLEKKNLLKVVRTAGLDVIKLKKIQSFNDGLEMYYNELNEVIL